MPIDENHGRDKHDPRDLPDEQEGRKEPLDDQSAGTSNEEVLDEVDEASRESFPASDSPAWTQDHA